ncbi:ATP-binding protein [Sphingomonas sp. CROZ-RG-20F-R02-07]|uniref:ATP-binding protein n=1 Tax=Sphingomonas sp. CROZ-RG-20F-R02-07 TaxID=2914832 RepID=UPI001F5601CA|nr:ATP-binding protein [Sphingomonas sp. CROZ-RG-20F-R02-07]
MTAPLPPGEAGSRNMLQLMQLRWMAIAGQLGTILLTRFAFDVALPMTAMLSVLTGLAALNAISILWLHWRHGIANTELLVALLLDIGALSAQLYLSGGATNPFVSLFLLQVVLGAVLLRRWSAWVVVGVTTASFALLTVAYRPLALPVGYTDTLFHLHVQGMWVCFALVAVLLLLFVRRIDGNLRARDMHLAELRRQADEEDHIVRIGLLASGAAHELGTPLSSLAVILGDWRRSPRIARDPELAAEVEEMRTEVQRCKAIVTGILLAAGEARGEASAATSVRSFFGGVFADWRTARGFAHADYRDDFGEDVPIVSDTVLQQAVFNVLDNAAEVSPDAIAAVLARDGDVLTITVTDRGPGFKPMILAGIGSPYHSTKARAGAGLGLFLVTSVMRKLGGSVTARNRAEGGAEVVLRLPLAAIALPEDRRHGR